MTTLLLRNVGATSPPPPPPPPGGGGGGGGGGFVAPTPTTVHELYEPSLGTLILTCDYGYVVNSYDLGFPEVRSNVANRTFDDGTLDYTQFQGGRTVQLALTLDGGVASNSSLRDRLSAYLQPDRRVEFRIQEPRDLRMRRMLLRGSKGGVAVSHPKFNKMTAAWQCPSGVIEGLTPHVVSVGPTTTEVGRTYDLTFDRTYATSGVSGGLATNAGTRAAQWTIRMYGALTNPVITLTDGAVQASLRFTANGGLVLAAGQVIVIESTGHLAYYDDGAYTPALQYLDFLTSTWFKIPGGDGVTPHDATVSLSASSFGAAGRIEVTFYDTWT